MEGDLNNEKNKLKCYQNQILNISLFSQMVGSTVNTVDLCASVCFVNHGRVPLLLESKEQCTS